MAKVWPLAVQTEEVQVLPAGKRNAPTTTATATATGCERRGSSSSAPEEEVEVKPSAGGTARTAATEQQGQPTSADSSRVPSARLRAEEGTGKPGDPPAAADASGGGSTLSSEKLLGLWRRYWNAWEHDLLPPGVWWDREAIKQLSSRRIVLLKPEGIFRGKAAVLREYANFSERFPPTGRHAKMVRKLKSVFVDEMLGATTAEYDVSIPLGVLSDESSSEAAASAVAQLGGDPCGGAGATYSVAEVLKWDVRSEAITEIHYYGQGLKLTPSNLRRDMLEKARMHSAQPASAELGPHFGFGFGFDFDFEGGDGDAGSALRSTSVSDDRPLAHLSVQFLRALVSCNEPVILSLASDGYRHHTTFGSRDIFQGIAAHQVDNASGSAVRGKVHAIHVDEARRVVSIERKYEVGDQMSEIIDVMYWDSQGQTVLTHNSYGFSWQQRGRGGSCSPGSEGVPSSARAPPPENADTEELGQGYLRQFSSKRSRGVCDDDDSEGGREGTGFPLRLEDDERKRIRTRQPKVAFV